MKKGNIYIILLFIYGLLHIGLNYYWIEDTCSLPFFDPAAHVERSLKWNSFLETFPFSIILKNVPLLISATPELGKALISQDISFSGDYPLIKSFVVEHPELKLYVADWSLLLNNYYPPLVHIISSLQYSILGTSFQASILSLSIFIFILIFSVYGIGRELYDKKTGFLAAILVMLYPAMYMYSRQYFLDFPLAAMVALSIYFLIKTKKFSSTRYSILFGISAGLGMLTKWSFAVFLALPFLYILYSAKEKNVKNIAFSVISTLFLAAPWYWQNLSVIHEIFSYSSLPVHGDSFFSAAGFNLLFLFKTGMTLFGLVFFYMGLLYFLKNKDERSNMLFFWLIGGLVFFLTLSSTLPRYVLPLYPVFALVTIRGITHNVPRTILFGVLIVLLVSIQGFFSVPLVAADFSFENWNDYSCTREDWKVKEILSSLPPESVVGVVDHHYPLSDDYFSYTAYREQLPLEVYVLRNSRSISKVVERGTHLIHIGNAQQNWADKERLNFLYGNHYLYKTTPYEIYAQLSTIDGKLIASYNLPKGVSVHVYKVIK